MEGFNWFTGFVFPYLNLFLFLYLASRFLKPPIITAIFKRSRDFRSALEKATAERDQAIAKQTELQKKLDTYDAHLESISDKIKSQANEEAHATISHAESLAAHLKAEAKKIANAELDRAREEIQKEILNSVQNKVIERIKNDLDPQAQAELIKKQFGVLSGDKSETKVVNLQKARAKG